jgi:Tripartite tricarboxylate transporter TctB family
MLHFLPQTATAAEERGKMAVRIKAPKDFWAGLMFIGVGGFFMIWALTHYQMGTAVRMGPAYFPAVLGGLMVFLGALVLIESFAMQGPPLVMPFNIVHLIVAMLIYAALGWIFKQAGIGGDYAVLAGTVLLVVLSVMFLPLTKPLILISAACVIYGYLMKPLGLVLSTLLLVFISAFAGHEFKWKEVAILYVALIVFSILVFVKGLTLPFPVCPAFMETCPIR